MNRLLFLLTFCWYVFCSSKEELTPKRPQPKKKKAPWVPFACFYGPKKLNLKEQKTQETCLFFETETKKQKTKNKKAKTKNTKTKKQKNTHTHKKKLETKEKTKHDVFLLGQACAQPDPWAQRLSRLPLERALRKRWDPKTASWSCSEVLVPWVCGFCGWCAVCVFSDFFFVLFFEVKMGWLKGLKFFFLCVLILLVGFERVFFREFILWLLRVRIHTFWRGTWTLGKLEKEVIYG